MNSGLEKVIRKTRSICPVCGQAVDASVVVRRGTTCLDKNCPQHGPFSAVIWRNKKSIFEWYGNTETLGAAAPANCPAECAENGLCQAHGSATCCVVLEVTGRCDLNCRYCFADPCGEKDRPAEEIINEIAGFVKPGKTLVQLSGGEPTLRDDLPEITAAAKKLGCKYVQLNSNGIRLADDESYVKKLADAGLSFVFLQFDGTDDDIYHTLRGRPMFAVKERAIELCARHNIGVTLVPVVVRGVNDRHIGDILRYAVSMSPAVRGVHFQPAAYLGRIPEIPDDNSRFTLDELICAVEDQSAGLIKSGNLQPSKCDHPLCGFHGDFVVLEDGMLHALTKKRGDAACCCGGAEDPADKNREFVGRRWQRQQADAQPSCCSSPADIEDMDYFLSRVATHGFTVTSMAFQDAGNMDLERLRMCSLHVAKDGKLIPFCVNYMTLWERG
ncbi:MAG: radical SAM protein [Synergistes sp.]|nr:radical SAM protein [Synergistes sp.]